MRQDNRFAARERPNPDRRETKRQRTDRRRFRLVIIQPEAVSNTALPRLATTLAAHIAVKAMWPKAPHRLDAEGVGAKGVFASTLSASLLQQKLSRLELPCHSAYRRPPPQNARTRCAALRQNLSNNRRPPGLAVAPENRDVGSRRIWLALEHPQVRANGSSAG